MKHFKNFLLGICIALFCVSCNNQEPSLAIFSVSATKQVEFSKGNLQYHPLNNVWRFAPHQTDYIGKDNAKISATYNGWIDLFDWGTGSTPTSTSACAETEDYTLSNFVDWGVNEIEESEPNTWRTLTYMEWMYLLEERPNAHNLSGIANVNSVNGLILLPDAWNCPNGITFIPGEYEDAGANQYVKFQSFSAEEWIIMEQAGAIFLPAGGSRFFIEKWNESTEEWGWELVCEAVQSDGFYWSGNIPSEAQDAEMILTFYFSADEIGETSMFPCYGANVRLVKDL